MSSTISQGDYGRVLSIWCRRDVSAYTTLQVVLTSPTRTVYTKTATIGSGALSTDLGTFPANEYIQYTIESGVLHEPGTWEVRARVSDASSQITGEPYAITVLPDDGIEQIGTFNISGV